MLKPSGFRFLVKPDETEEITAGGIVLPKTAIDREQRGIFSGVLVDKGKECKNGMEDIPIGAHIWFNRYAGRLIEDPDSKVEYLVINDEDLLSWDDATPSDGGE